MSWMTWEVGNYLYFVPFIVVVFAWSRASLIGFTALGAAILTYPFLVYVVGDPSEIPGNGGYDSTVSWSLWLLGLVLFILSTIRNAFRLWIDKRLVSRDSRR